MARSGKIPVRQRLRRARPGAREGRVGCRGRAEDRRSRGARLSGRLRGRPARGQGRERPPRRARDGRDQRFGAGHRLAASATSRPEMETEAVDVAIAVARKLCADLVAARAARRDRGAGQGLLPRIWWRRRISSSASTTHSMTSAREEDRTAGQAERLRGPAGDPGRAGNRDRRLQDRMGRRRCRAGARHYRSQGRKSWSDATSAASGAHGSRGIEP